MSNAKSVFVPTFRLSVMVLVLGLLSGCANIAQYSISAFGINTTPIRDLKPPQNENTYVYVQGKVTGVVPLVKQKAYQIDDTTGRIWVITDKTAVQVDNQIKIKGKLRYQDIKVGNNQLGEVYLEEQQQVIR